MKMSFDTERNCYQMRDGTGAYEYYPSTESLIYRTEGRAVALNIDSAEKAVRIAARLRSAHGGGE